MLAIHGLAESFPAGILPGVQKGYVVQFDRKILGTYTGQLLGQVRRQKFNLMALGGPGIDRCVNYSH